MQVVTDPESDTDELAGSDALEVKLAASTEVEFSSQGLTLGGLTTALDNFYCDPLYLPVARMDEEIKLTMSATLGDVITALGLVTTRGKFSGKSGVEL